MGRHSSATERTLSALRELGRLDEIDAAQVALARGLAVALDDVDPATSTYPNIVRQYAAVLERLTSRVEVDDGASPADEFLAGLVGPGAAAVGDPPD